MCFPSDRGRLIFEATYKIALTNTFSTPKTHRGWMYTQTTSAPECRGAAWALHICKGLASDYPSMHQEQENTPRLRFSLKGGGRLGLVSRLSRDVSEPHCFL